MTRETDEGDATEGDATGGRQRGRPHEPVVFSQVARLELDQLLEQLVDRAQDVLATQGRLRGLLAATQAIAQDVSPTALLRTVVEAACELVGARYGALGVIGPRDELAEFVTVGLDEASEQRIGDRPRGRGILGLLIAEPTAVRLADIGAHDRSVGFPPHHPPMRTFVGVPIKMRDRVFGNLYLAEKAGGLDFTADDQQVLTSLASAAAVSIENAQLLSDAQRRQRWLSASARVSHELLRGGADPLPLVATLARDAADADLATIAVDSEDDADSLVVAAADGVGSDEVGGQRVPRQDSNPGRALLEDRDLIIDEIPEAPRGDPAVEVSTGPALIVRLDHDEHSRGALVLRRRAGRTPFTENELEMAADFARQAALALQMSRAQTERQRARMVEDRDLIAQDLQQDVIGSIFSVGMGLQAVSGRHPELADELEQLVQSLDSSMSALRRSIYMLYDDKPATPPPGSSGAGPG
jgi:GAF domain-containing protein